jgi:hypothetical protein
MNALETMNYVTRKDKVHLVTGNEATEKKRGYSFTHSNVGCRWRWVVNATPPQVYTGEGDLIPIVGERTYT